MNRDTLTETRVLGQGCSLFNGGLLDVVGDDLALLADQGGEKDGVVAIAAGRIDDGIALANQVAKQQVSEFGRTWRIHGWKLR